MENKMIKKRQRKKYKENEMLKRDNAIKLMLFNIIFGSKQTTVIMATEKSTTKNN